MDFENKPPEWLVGGTEPPEDLRKKDGWLAGYKPPASYFNWFWNTCYLCIKELQEKLAGVDSKHAEDVASINAAVKKKAPLDSPNLTGVPTAPTADKGTATDQIATTKFVNNIVGAIDFSALQDHTKYVTNANLNTLLDDQAYICAGVMTNAPMSTTYCVVRAYDTGSTNRVVQVCYVPQSDSTVRTFVRSVNGGSVFGKWYEYGNVKSVNGIKADSTGNVAIPYATSEVYGLTKLADETALLKEEEAVVQVPLMYEINDFRRMNTAYQLGDRVACAFLYDVFLECTSAGTTSGETLDTRNVTHGQVIQDGTCQWTVRTHVRSINNAVADSNGNVTISAVTLKVWDE